MFLHTWTFYEFGPFRVDPRERRLLRNGEVVPLTPKVFDVLLALVQSGGHIMTRDEIMKLVWPDATVEDGNITRNISTLRVALGEQRQYVETVPWRGYRFAATVREVRDESTDPSFGSIVVLPFVNVAGAPDIEYLADGITESLISNLSQSPRLKVMSRNSAFRYRGRETDARTVGRELNVRAVLMGRISVHDQMLSVSVEMVDALDDRQVWGAQYIRKLEDIFTTQATIVREITERLRLKLTGPEQQRLTRRHTDDPEAWHSYLKGRYYFNKLTMDGVHKAIEHFQQAIERAPGYALAHTGLGDCYNYLEKPAEAREAFNAALKLDPTLGEAHASMGFFRFIYDWDFAEAEKAFNQALEFNPNYAEAHHWYAIFLANMGRHQEAEAEARRAQELDPLSLLMNLTPALTSYMARQHDRSAEALKKIIDMEPTFPAAHSVLGNVYVQTEMYDEAMAEYQRVIELSKGVPGIETNMNAIIGHLHARRGDRGGARSKLDEVANAIAEGIRVPAYVVAAVHSALGDTDSAFEWLENALQQREVHLVSLKVDPYLDGVRADERFAELVRRVGLPGG
jgi:TolB-like protein/tetratricopeptide (TPR) repeat protein